MCIGLLLGDSVDIVDLGAMKRGVVQQPTLFTIDHLLAALLGQAAVVALMTLVETVGAHLVPPHHLSPVLW